MLIVALALIAPIAAQCCNVPVFRYAMERWWPDLFEVVVFHRGELSPELEILTQKLKAESADAGKWGNFHVRIVDLAGELKPGVAKLWQSQTDAKPPWLAVLYPLTAGMNLPAWSAPLNAESVGLLLASPARTQIAQDLIAGKVAAWVVIESGNDEKDRAAVDKLQGWLKEMEKLLRPSDWMENDADPDAPPASGVSFSVIRLARNAPGEAAFVSMLLSSEDDLATFREPIAFPIFGRGRVLYALVGQGITRDNVLETCAFLTGPCSCQAKALNPGIDALMCADWESGIVEEYVPPEEVPPLVGLTTGQATATLSPGPATATPPPAMSTPPPAAEPPAGSALLVRSATLAAVVGLALLTVGALVMRRQRP